MPWSRAPRPALAYNSDHRCAPPRSKLPGPARAAAGPPQSIPAAAARAPHAAPAARAARSPCRDLHAPRSPGFYVIEDEPAEVLETADDGVTPLVVAPRIELTLEWLIESPPPEHTWAGTDFLLDFGLGCVQLRGWGDACQMRGAG